MPRLLRIQNADLLVRLYRRTGLLTMATFALIPLKRRAVPVNQTETRASLLTVSAPPWEHTPQASPVPLRIALNRRLRSDTAPASPARSTSQDLGARRRSFKGLN